MFLKINIEKQTKLNFIMSAHTVICLYLWIMWCGRVEKPFLVGFGFVCTVFSFSVCRFVPNQCSDTSASSRCTIKFGIPLSSISRNCLSPGLHMMSCISLELTPQEYSRSVHLEILDATIFILAPFSDVVPKYCIPQSNIRNECACPSVLNTKKALPYWLFYVTWYFSCTFASERIFKTPSLWYHTVPNPSKSPTQFVLNILALQWIFIRQLTRLMFSSMVWLHKMLSVDCISKSIYHCMIRPILLHSSTCWFMTMLLRSGYFPPEHYCKPIYPPRTSIQSCRPIVLK